MGRYQRFVGKLLGSRASKLSQLGGGLVKLPQIPDDVICSNIIPRLPGKSLLKFKSVSRLWDSTISYLISTLSADPQNAKAVFMLFEDSEKLSAGVFEGIPRFYFVDSQGLIQKFSWARTVLENCDERCIAGSCDGLLLIILRTSLYLWNPWTTYFSHVLELDDLICDYDVSDVHYVVTNSGISYDPCTDDYKVVIGLTNIDIYTPGCKSDPFLVAGLRNKRWKNLNFPYRCHMKTAGVLLKGFLHWRAICTDDDFFDEWVPPNKIIAFDPKTDQVSEVPLPEYCTSKGFYVILGLGALEGCLCMACWDDQALEVIAMKEYGVEESWTPLFEISNLICDQSPFPRHFRLYDYSLIPLMLMQNGHVLMAIEGLKDVKTFSYNPQTMEYNHDYPKASDRCGFPLLFIESLNSPAGLKWDESQGHSTGYRMRKRRLDTDSEDEYLEGHFDTHSEEEYSMHRSEVDFWNLRIS